MFSVKEAAKFLSVSEKTIYRWVNAGSVPFTRVGEQYRFNRQELLAWAASVGRSIPTEFLREEDNSDEELPDLSVALRLGGIHYRIGGTTPIEVIEEMSGLLKLPLNIDSDYVREALTAREALASTAIGEGIAVPHMRHPLMAIDTPMVSLGFLAEPVDWGALDGKPVRFIFVPCCPSIRSHLHILKQISFAAQHEDFRNCLDSEAMRNDILETLEKIKNTIGAF